MRLVRTLVSFCVTLAIGAILGLGLPYVLFTAWKLASSAAGTGGGMFYFPTTIPEMIVFPLLCLSILPAFLAFVVVGLLLGFLLGQLGLLDAESGLYLLFDWPTRDSSPGSILLTLAVLTTQVLAYGLAARYLLPLLFRKVRLTIS